MKNIYWSPCTRYKYFLLLNCVILFILSHICNTDKYKCSWWQCTKNYEEHALLKFGMGRHPAGSSVNSTFFEEIRKFWLGFTIAVYEKIYFEAYINNQCIWYKNKTAQLYFMLEKIKLCWNFSIVPKEDSDIDRFTNRKWVLSRYTEGNLWISEASLSQLEKFQRRP